MEGGPGWNLIRSGDVDPVLLAEAGEASREAGGVGAEHPLVTTLDQLGEHDDDLDGRIHVELVLGELLAAVGVDRTDVRVVDEAEVLLALDALVDGDGEDDLLGFGRDLLEVDLDDLVVAVADTGEVVTGVVHGTLGRVQVAPVHEVLVAEDEAVRAEDEGAGVEVEVSSGDLAALGIPAEADVQSQQEAAGFLGQVDLGALGEGNGHGDLSFWGIDPGCSPPF